jgi:hypothetical protein
MFEQGETDFARLFGATSAMNKPPVKPGLTASKWVDG